MKNIIKKYKYIILFVILIILTSIFFTCNYKIIETFSGNRCESILDDPHNALSQNRTESNNQIYYTCPEGRLISFFGPPNPKLSGPNFRFNRSIHDNINNIDECVDTATRKGHDTFFFNKENKECSSSILLPQLGENLRLQYTCQENNNLQKPGGLFFEGRGGFTKKGRRKINDNNVKYLDPRCDVIQEMFDDSEQLTGCLENPESEDCNGYGDIVVNNARLIDKALGVDNAPFADCITNDRDECLAQSFRNGNYLGSTRDMFTENLLNDASLNEIDFTIDEYKNTLAQNNESSLQTTSTYIIYLFFILVLIISVIIITLNIIKPDIITAETLTGFIIFLVLIIFVTSNYFNVDYGPLNKFLTFHLGNAGSRNIFQNIGYSA